MAIQDNSTVPEPQRRNRRASSRRKLYARPVIPLRELVVFPGIVVPLMVGRERSTAAVQEALKKDSIVFLITQRNAVKDEIEPADLYSMGCQARLLQTMKLPDGALKVVAEVVDRARAAAFIEGEPFLIAECRAVSTPKESGEDDRPLAGLLVQKFRQYVALHPMIPDKVAEVVDPDTEVGRLADTIAAHLSIKIDDKQTVLETVEARERAEQLAALLDREIEMLDSQRHIQERLRDRVQKNQREYLLKEQMRLIEEELGHDEGDAGRFEELRQRIDGAGMPEDVKEAATKELNRLVRTPPMTPQASVIENYIDTLASLPWRERTDDNLDIEAARRTLNEDHYGLDEPKKRILEYLAVRALTKRPMGTILCLVGPPGVGKTSLARSVARSMGRRFVRKSLGGVRDEAEIRGHRRTYVGAMPGRIVQSMIKAGSRNPVFLLDEIDKLSRDYHGDPGSALLEALDPDENANFSDHFLEVPFPLNEVFFLATANHEGGIPHVLRDRMEIIRIAGYSALEKLHIADKYIVPQELHAHGLTKSRAFLGKPALRAIIGNYTREAGVRELKRRIAAVLRGVAVDVAEGKVQGRVAVKPAGLARYLGPAPFVEPPLDEDTSVGVATGLAWTETGGRLMPVEALKYPGRRRLELTGSLGDVMKESAQAALSYLRANAGRLGIEQADFNRYDLHVHVPEGAVPKDGPSAGVTLATALASCLSGRQVDRKLAMTGEIDLRGHVLTVGGIREKLLAAHRDGLRRVAIPTANMQDIEMLPAEVRDALTITPVKTLNEVFDLALLPPKD